MAVTILSPTSQLVDRTGGVTLAWKSDYPQSAYEILYRKKGQTAWSTLGRVTGAAQQAALDTARFTDCVEYHYRVVCYAQGAESDADTQYTGSDTSPAYSLILAPGAQAMLKVRGSAGMVEVPLYGDLRGEGPELKVRLGAGLGRAALVERGAALASPLSFRTSQGIRAAAGRTPRCEDPGVPGSTELDVRKRYYEAYAYQHEYNYRYTYRYSEGVMRTGYAYAYGTSHYLQEYTGVGTYWAYGGGYRLVYYTYTGTEMVYHSFAYQYSYTWWQWFDSYGYRYQDAREQRYHYAEKYYNYAIRA